MGKAASIVAKVELGVVRFVGIIILNLWLMINQKNHKKSTDHTIVPKQDSFKQIPSRTS